MGRSKDKGTKFETQVLRYLCEQLPFMDMDRMPLKGGKDEGDIRGFSIRGKKCVIECKNHNRLELAAWIDEVEAERGNADAEYAFVVFKRRGCGERNMGGTYVLTTLDDLTALAAGSRELRGRE